MTDERLRELEREALAGSKDALDELVRLRQQQVRRPEAHLCWICGGVVSAAEWSAHLEACGARKRARGDDSKARRATSDQGAAFSSGVAARPYKVPLWSRATLEAGTTEVSFFLHGKGGHSNLGADDAWPHPWLPPNSVYFAWGIALVPDAGSDFEVLVTAWNAGTFSFCLGSATPREWPARAVMTNPALLPRLEGGYAAGFDSPRAVLTVKRDPVQILCLERITSGLRVPEPLGKPLTFMLIFYGIRLVGITS